MRCCRTTQLDFKHEEPEGGEQTLQAHICTLESRCKHVTLWLHCYFYCSYDCKAKRKLFQRSLEIRIGLEYVEHHTSHVELLSFAISLDHNQTKTKIRE